MPVNDLRLTKLNENIKLNALQSAKDLNGLYGTFVGYEHDSRRYRVRLVVAPGKKK